VGYLWEAVVVLFMGVEDHQEGDLWEEVVDLHVEVDPQVEVDPRVLKDLQKKMEANFQLEAQVYLLVLPSQVPLETHGTYHGIDH
jgi:hypothetical protein